MNMKVCKILNLIMNNKFKILIIFLFMYGCYYPNVNEVPREADLKITEEDKMNLKNLKEKVEE